MLVYVLGINNHFFADDFVWLYRAKTLTENVTQIFRPDVLYFDPIVHLSFYVNYLIGGLNPVWYHGVDIALHAINSVLVYRLAHLLSQDDKASLYASILFASSFAIADAVLWPSSRVDLLSVMFSLGALIRFVTYLTTRNLRHLTDSCLLFALALAAKGTPVVLPLVLIWLAVMEIKSERSCAACIPHVVMAGIFFLLLKVQLARACNPLTNLHICVRNVSLALRGLFIPERIASTMNPVFVTHALAALVLVFGLVMFSPEYAIVLRRTGLVILFCSIAPMLILGGFKTVTAGDDPIALLHSPSHRIYFASVGAALLGGGALRAVEALLGQHARKYAPSLCMAVVLSLAVLGNAGEVARRNRIWHEAGQNNHTAYNGLLAYQNKFVKGSQIVLVNFPGALGFTTPMLQLYCKENDIKVLMTCTELGVLEEPEVLRKADKSFLFVCGADQRVYDFSELFRMKLSSNIAAMKHGYDRPYMDRCNYVAAVLNRQIENLVQ